MTLMSVEPQIVYFWGFKPTLKDKDAASDEGA